MDNNLDATRLNPYGNANMQKKREPLPPLPSEPSATQMRSPAATHTIPTTPGYTAAAGASAAAGYPTIAGATAPTGYPSTAGFPTVTGYPAPGVYTPPQQMMGFPTMPGMNGTAGAQGLTPITPFNQPIPVTTETMLYMNGFLRTVIGRRVTVDFLIGTNTLTDRTGTLLAVGANYIVINEVETDDILICDFYSIKFVKVYY